MRAIAGELDESEDTRGESEKYRERILELKLPEESEEKLLKETDRLSRMQGSSQEASVIRTYLDTCLDLPWNTETVDNLDIVNAEAQLDKDHYGLKGERAHSGAAGAQAYPGREEPDYLPGGPSRCGQNLHCKLHCPGAGPQICPHEPGRRARRSRDSRPPPHLHRGHARQAHQRHWQQQKPQPAVAAGRN